MLTPQTTQESAQKQTQNINSKTQQDASDYHALASVAELLVTLRNENQNNKYKTEKKQYTKMDFIDKKTGEVFAQRVLF